METKEYFEKVMQDYNQNRKGRTLRKYCKDEAVDYDWLIKYKKSYPDNVPSESSSDVQSFIPLIIEEEKKPDDKVWQVSCLRLETPDGVFIEINSNNLAAVTSLLLSISSPC